MHTKAWLSQQHRCNRKKALHPLTSLFVHFSSMLNTFREHTGSYWGLHLPDPIMNPCVMVSASTGLLLGPSARLLSLPCEHSSLWLHVLQVPKKWREELRERQISTGRSKLHHSVTAADGTRKFLLQLHDGLIVEAVGIPADDADKSRLTACVSSQVTLNLAAALHLCICASVPVRMHMHVHLHVLLDGWLAPS